ncbi:exonuclease SbcCD subunit D [Halobacteriovorax sp. HLS]|uniref:metallophosphoesterase family protein n=1 Tax=Halobacteriovorax sp. HLS TaxID=2234000 RepID=UPI000FD71153|nr:exonuclease SbcCD subunit D [Halobacteriovorax sp. HLS]
MKIIHTSDWHLGKKLYRSSRSEEQRKFLDWLTQYIITNKVDLLLISGDIFDVPSPPNDALKLYFDFLKSITDSCDIKIFIISGNHDSANFLMAPAPFLENNNIFISGNLTDLLEDRIEKYTTELTIKGERVNISMLPYFRTHELYNLAKKWNLDYDQGPLIILENILEKLKVKNGAKSILMAHHLFGSYEEAGSELGLTLSGIESIPTKLLADFDYVALGHIHKSQTLSKDSPVIHYSGSPMAFRFSETTTKTFSEIIIEDNQLNYSLVDIQQFDKLLRVSCTNEELEQYKEQLISTYSDSELVIYVEFKIKTDVPITGLADKLRSDLAEHSIHLLSVQTIVQKSTEHDQEHFLEKSLTTEELFKMYYQKKFPNSKELPTELREDFIKLLTQVRENTNETSVN